LTRRPGRPQDRVDLKTEARILCPSNVTLNNFHWDPVTERVWMVDFQHVNVLPQSFTSFYFHTADPFAKEVAERIDLPVSSQLSLLVQAAIIVMQSGNTSLGKPRRVFASAIWY
jgi:hypothetical protein